MDKWVKKPGCEQIRCIWRVRSGEFPHKFQNLTQLLEQPVGWFV